MSIYLGKEGQLAIKRSSMGTGAKALATVLEVGDVSVKDRRFSADFPSSALITGDKIDIATQDKSNLELVKGHVGKDGSWFCHVDQAGGIRLYNDFSNALSGKLDTALELITPSKVQPLYIGNRDETYNFVGQTTEWQLTTQREQVDLTVLGEDFRDNFANGLISGQGQTTCLWDYQYDSPCDTWNTATKELPHYYAQLLLRLEQGSMFKGQFFIHYEKAAQSVWYQCDCIVTSVGFAFAPEQLVRTNVQFVTSGEIKLVVAVPTGKMLIEDGMGRASDSVLLQESSSSIEIENED